MVNRAYYDEYNPVGESLFYVRRRRHSNNFGPSQDQVYDLISRTEGERGARAGGEGPRLSPYRPLPGIGEAQTSAQAPPRPRLVRERTYDVLKPRRRPGQPAGAEATSLEVEDIDTDAGSQQTTIEQEETRKPIKSILKKREQPGNQQQHPSESRWERNAENDGRLTRKNDDDKMMVGITTFRNDLRNPNTESKIESESYQNNPPPQQHPNYPEAQDHLRNFSNVSSIQHPRFQHPDYPQAKDHLDQNEYHNDPAYSLDNFWPRSQEQSSAPIPRRIDTRSRRQNERRTNRTITAPATSRGAQPQTSSSWPSATSQGFTNRLAAAQGKFNSMEMSKASVAFGPRMASNPETSRTTNLDSWFD